MEYRELRDASYRIVESLSRSAPAQDWSDVLHLLEYGEIDEALDVLVATLVRWNIPVTTQQHGAVGDLMRGFPFTPETRPIYAYLGDLEMLDRMTVVDEPAP